MLASVAFVFSSVVAGGLAWAIWQAVELRRGVRGTTLTTTAHWGIGVAVLWEVAWCCSVFVSPDRTALQNQLWYWTAVVSLIPPIAVLGAKRPGSEAWNFFVLIPLALVLGWPALTVWTSHGPGALQVETPVLMGFVLVLVMGCGNYIATRLAFPALLYALSVVLVLAPCSTVTAATGVPAEGFRGAGVASLLLLVWLARTILRQPSTLANGPERVWNDFREMFGIVWMKRALDRINEEFAEREQWPARLGTDGLEWPTAPSAEERSRIEARLTYALHWLLRRFVDPQWIDERLRLEPDASETN